jgi:energy-coupling factor transporter ATP-binding protein EcfA2
VSQPVRRIGVGHGLRDQGHKIVVYGPGGIGKSELCSLLGQVAIEAFFIDLEDGTRFMEVARADPAPENWSELRAALHDEELLRPFGAVVIDSVTRAEELAVSYTLATVKHEKGHDVDRIEDYGFGKGYTHVYETFLKLLGDVDAIARAGKHVILVAHDCTTSVPNPTGEDFLQYQPRLQSPPKTGKVRERVKEWCDHLLFIGWDRFVNKEGKATGNGSRTIYPREAATHWAKSRVLSDPMVYEQGNPVLWQILFGKDDS